MKFSVEKTRNAIPVDCIKVFSDVDLGIKGSEFIELPKPFGLYEYSTFMIKDLNQYIDTDHVLICQYDGIGINPEFWNEKFLQYDCIGSATYYKHPPLFKTLSECKLVDTLEHSWYPLGGGFCLRSKKLLNALSDPEVLPYFHNYAINAQWSCEDISIGMIYRKFMEEKYGIVYGSFEDSVEFCAEILSAYNFCLGFHGWDQIPLFLNEDETLFWINEYCKGAKDINIYKIKRFMGFAYLNSYDNVIRYIKRNFNIA